MDPDSKIRRGISLRARTFRTSYREDLKLFPNWWNSVWLGLFLLFLLLLPFFAGSYAMVFVTMVCIAAIGAIGLNLLTGFGGQISLGHAAFIALGAYTTAILVSRFGLPIFVTMPAAGMVALFGGLIIGWPCLRLKGLYLAMATMCFGFIVQYALTHWESLTMGVIGISVDPPSFFGYQFDTQERMYYLILCTTILLTVLAGNIVRTKTGRAFVAIRDRDVAAEIMGINLTKYKILAFLISAFYAGVAGCLYAYNYMYVHVEAFSLEMSLRYLCMIITGGLGSVAGSIVGATFITMIPDVIKLAAAELGEVFPIILEKYDDEWSVAAFGLLIILFLIIEPGGLFRVWKRVKTCFVNWPFTY